MKHLKLKNKISLRKLLNNKRFTVTFSIILSFTIWLVIMINRNPTRDQTFTNITANISIEDTVAKERGLGIVSDYENQSFSVTVSGPNYVVSSLRAEDILLYADVTEVTSAGTYKLEVSGVKNSDKSGYTFSNITPRYLEVTFDYIDTKEFAVVPKLIGVGTENGLIAESPTVTSSEQTSIVIKGPRSVMDRINSVEANKTVNKILNSTQTYDADIILYDEELNVVYKYASDGKIYDANDNVVSKTYLDMEFTTIKVTQPISKKVTLPVKPSFENMPKGISLDSLSWSLDQTSATIIGVPEVVEKINEIVLSPIDFRDITPSKTVTFEATAVLPDGVKLLDNIEYFNVSVDATNFSKVTFNISDIRTSGLSSSLTAKTTNVIRNVTVCGPKSIIREISATDLYAVLDLTDKSEGEHTVSAVIATDKYDTVWQLGEYSTTVTIKSKN